MINPSIPVFDEFVEPTVICNGEEPIATIGKNDSVIFFNFRPDRAREITRTLVDPEFNEFETKKDLKFDRMIYFLEKALIPPKILLENILTCSAPQVVVVL